VTQAGQLVLLRFPQTDLEEGKLRPVLMLGRLPGDFDDWLVCMVSSQLRHCVSGFDEIVQQADDGFAESGLKTVSVIRVGRLATVEGDVLVGAIGEISATRLQRVRDHLTRWLANS
jgi:mRNA interferase MazF